MHEGFANDRLGIRLLRDDRCLRRFHKARVNKRHRLALLDYRTSGGNGGRGCRASTTKAFRSTTGSKVLNHRRSRNAALPIAATLIRTRPRCGIDAELPVRPDDARSHGQAKSRTILYPVRRRPVANGFLPAKISTPGFVARIDRVPRMTLAASSSRPTSARGRLDGSLSVQCLGDGSSIEICA